MEYGMLTINTREELVEVLTIALYDLDPATTCCNMNDVYDEYVTEAERAAKLFTENGMSFKSALFRTFDEQFAGAYNDTLLSEVYRNINERMV
jgi:hypothetical protein